MEVPSFLRFAVTRLYRDKVRRKLSLPLTFTPRTPSKGRVLVSYTAHPFTITKTELLRSPHTNSWECLAIVEALLDEGYSVDVIDWTNTTFVPKHSYVQCIDIHTNLERLAPLLGPKCTHLFYATGSYWKYQNAAEKERLEELLTRRGIVLMPRRQIAPEQPESVAQRITALGNRFAASTYAFAGVPVISIPLLSTTQYPSPYAKDFESIRNNYVFIGGGGAVHKGLDRVLEFFAKRPEYKLTVCGPFAHEEDFAKAYHRELYELPNITFVGRIDIRGEAFARIIGNAIGLVYPSCSEGQSGSVITGLHAGLIPLVTYQSGVTGEPFGKTLPDASEESIAAAIAWLSALPASELRERSIAAWEYANAHHTYGIFKESYRQFLAATDS